MDTSNGTNKMGVGDSIGQFLIEEVIRPLKDGNALLKVRYEGSYVRGYLCAVDVRQYGAAYDNDEKLLYELRELCKVLMALDGGITNKKAGACAFLPDRIFSCISVDGGTMVLGYFRGDNGYRESVQTKMTLDDLGIIAKSLDVWHKNGIAHGTLHPRGMRKTDDGRGWIFSCPIFPVVLHDAETAWTYTFGNKSIEKDRKAFGQMIADVLNGDNDAKGFCKRMEFFETNDGVLPLFSSFLCDKNVTCEQLVKNAVEEKKKNDIFKLAQITIRLRNRRLVWFICIAAVCVVTLSATFYVIAQRTEEARRIKVSTTIADARDAKGVGDWQTCLGKAQAILAIQPNHKEAISLRIEAKRCIEVSKVLADARDAKKCLRWQDCKDKAGAILAEAPENIEALELRSYAESMMRSLSDAVEAARQAKKNRDWQVCIQKAKEALVVEPDHIEANELKTYAESMIKLGAVLVEAREAQDNKKWMLCVQIANKALVIDNANPVALELKTNAESMLGKLSDALASAREAKGNKEWEMCLSKANEAILIDPVDNEEAKVLKSDAERGIKILAALAAALEAKERRNWQTCLSKANEALSAEPGHLKGEEFKLDAERMIRLLAALASAREAKMSSQWKRCAEMANKAAEISEEPEHSEALVLKSDAERKLKLITVLVAAREAKMTEKWPECEARADEILTIEPNHAEALELKSYAKSMVKTQIASLVASARAAKGNKEWQVCLDKVNEAFLLEPNNVEVKALKEEADRQIRVSALLSEGRDLKKRSDWLACAGKCDEVLALDAGNVEAMTLKKELCQYLEPRVIFKVCWGNVEAVAKIWDGAVVRDSAQPLQLRKNIDYDFLFWFKSSRDPYGKVFARCGNIKLQATWEGLKEYPVPLTEAHDIGEGELNNLLKSKGVPPGQW